MKKLLIYVVTFNHEKFIENTINRINPKIFENYETEILINDDSSTDKTLDIIKKLKQKFTTKVRFNILSRSKKFRIRWKSKNRIFLFH